MKTKRLFLLGGLVVTIAIVGFYGAMAQSGRHSAAPPARTIAADVALPMDGALPASEAVACQEDKGNSRPSPNATCNNCTSDQECISLNCGGCAPDIACVQFGLKKRCMCI